MAKPKIKLHIVFAADVTLDDLFDTRSDKVLEFPDKPAVWAHLFKERGRSYEQLTHADSTDASSDIYILRKY